MAVGRGDWPPRVLVQPAPSVPDLGVRSKSPGGQRHLPLAPAESKRCRLRRGAPSCLSARLGFSPGGSESESTILETCSFSGFQIHAKLSRVVNLLQPVHPQTHTHTETYRRPPGAPSRSGGCPGRKAPSNHLGPRAPGTRCPPAVLPTPGGLHKLSASDRKAESSLQTPSSPGPLAPAD